MTLLERIDAAIAHAKKIGRAASARALATKAGLSPGYFGKTRGDLARSPGADLGSDTLARIADAAGVRAEWLQNERGSMLDSEGSQAVAPGVVARIRSRGRARGLPEETIDAALGVRGLRGVKRISDEEVDHLLDLAQGFERGTSLLFKHIVTDAGTDNPLDDFRGGIGDLLESTPPPRPSPAKARAKARTPGKSGQKRR